MPVIAWPLSCDGQRERDDRGEQRDAGQRDLPLDRGGAHRDEPREVGAERIAHQRVELDRKVARRVRELAQVQQE